MSLVDGMEIDSGVVLGAAGFSSGITVGLGGGFNTSFETGTELSLVGAAEPEAGADSTAETLIGAVEPAPGVKFSSEFVAESSSASDVRPVASLVMLHVPMGGEVAFVSPDVVPDGGSLGKVSSVPEGDVDWTPV